MARSSTWLVRVGEHRRVYKSVRLYECVCTSQTRGCAGAGWRMDFPLFSHFFNWVKSFFTVSSPPITMQDIWGCWEANNLINQLSAAHIKSPGALLTNNMLPCLRAPERRRGNSLHLKGQFLIGKPCVNILSYFVFEGREIWINAVNRRGWQKLNDYAVRLPCVAHI